MFLLLFPIQLFGGENNLTSFSFPFSHLGAILPVLREGGGNKRQLIPRGMAAMSTCSLCRWSMPLFSSRVQAVYLLARSVVSSVVLWFMPWPSLFMFHTESWKLQKSSSMISEPKSLVCKFWWGGGVLFTDTAHMVIPHPSSLWLWLTTQAFSFLEN